MTHTKDEALKLALEFANDIQRGNYKGNAEEIITAIKQALAAPVQSCYCPNCEAMGKELAALKAHLTEEKKVELATNWFAEDWAITKAVGMLHDYDRLLRDTTQPSAQPAVPLTDEQAEFELVFKLPSNCTKFQGGYAPTSHNAWEAQAFCARWEGWKARSAHGITKGGAV